MMVLLDTCAFIWYLEGSNKLSPKATSILDTCPDIFFEPHNPMGNRDQKNDQEAGPLHDNGRAFGDLRPGRNPHPSH